MKTFLMTDDRAKSYYVLRRDEDQLKPEFTQGLAVGDVIPLSEHITLTRES